MTAPLPPELKAGMILENEKGLRRRLMGRMADGRWSWRSANGRGGRDLGGAVCSDAKMREWAVGVVDL